MGRGGGRERTGPPGARAGSHALLKAQQGFGPSGQQRPTGLSGGSDSRGDNRAGSAGDEVGSRAEPAPLPRPGPLAEVTPRPLSGKVAPTGARGRLEARGEREPRGGVAGLTRDVQVQVVLIQAVQLLRRGAAALLHAGRGGRAAA